MIRSLPIPDDLSHHLRGALLIDVPAASDAVIPASGKTYLIVPGTRQTGFRGDLAFLSGPPTEPFVLPSVGGRHAFLAIEFTLAGQFALFGDAVRTNDHRLVHDVWPLPAQLDKPLHTIAALIRVRPPAAYRELRIVQALEHGPWTYGCVSDMASELGVSGATLRRHVSRVCGRSPRRLLAERRLAQTFRDLYDTAGQDLSMLAHSQRFSDHAHLTRSFRQFSGVAPSTLDREAFALARGMYGSPR